MRTAEKPAVAVTGLRKVYPEGRVALNGVDMRVEPYTLTAIAGPNGSGKTTLLRILAGMLSPTAGSVQVLGVNAQSGTDRSLRSRISFATQDVALDPEMTGVQTLRLFAALYGVPRQRTKERVEKLADAFGLTEHLRAKVYAYSGGLRRRLHLAIAFLHEPELLLLDEPTAGLDPSARGFLWTLLRSHARSSGSVILVTHDLTEVERFCDHTVVLSRGNVLADGSPPELVRDHAARTLELNLVESLEMGDPRLRPLSSLDGVSGLRVKDRRIWVQITEEWQIKQKILSALASMNVEVESFTTHEPDLAGAYYKLTGETSEASAEVKSESRRKRSRAPDRLHEAAP